jgi:hypothetical protein
LNAFFGGDIHCELSQGRGVGSLGSDFGLRYAVRKDHTLARPEINIRVFSTKWMFSDWPVT